VVGSLPDPGRSLRWDPYLMEHGAQFTSFWKDYLSRERRDLLYVLGAGFDPRMCRGLRSVLGEDGDGKRDCLLVEFDEGADSPSLHQDGQKRANREELDSLMASRGSVIPKRVNMWAGSGLRKRRIGSRSASQIFGSEAELASYSTVLVDISAMPRSIYFSVIAKLLYILDRAADPGAPRPRLYVIVTEDPSLDSTIRDVGVDETANYIHGFGAEVSLESTAGVPKVWIPVLGEGQSEQLERIRAFVDPDEICPVLPSPALNPRRADELVEEYRELLFDRWRVEVKNIIYGSERNPFDVYRLLCRTARHYNETLAPLGGCKIVLSAVSSKLLSVAVLLAAYELRSRKLRVGLAHVEPRGYELVAAAGSNSVPVDGGELFCLRLA
jgi:hypothetical protein